MVLVFITLFLLSLALALRSMKDLDVPNEVHKMLAKKKVKGTFILMKGKKVKHYSSTSSSS